jgi:quercetin dioxygenase-like cupin family protein
MKRRLKWLLLAVVAGAGAYATTLLATPSSGFTATTLAVARFDEIDVKNFTLPAKFWQARLKTQGLSDVYVQSNVFAPVTEATAGGTSGWHTHPGHSLILVTAGTITAYEGDDPTCTPHVYAQGAGFVDHGGGHVHLLRNEGAIEARTIAVQLTPAASTRRIDAPPPGNCPF